MSPEEIVPVENDAPIDAELAEPLQELEWALPADSDKPAPPEPSAILLTDRWPEPKAPHPSFGWSILWCLLFLLMTQIIPGLGVAVLFILVKVVRTGHPNEVLGQISSKEGSEAFQSEALLPMLVAAEVAGILFSLLAIRLVVGRDWKREIALRLPTLPHLLLILAGFPALPFAASGAYYVAKEVIPGIPHLLPLSIAAILVIAFLWPAIRAFAGRGWNERLALEPMVHQYGYVTVGFGVFVLAGTFTYLPLNDLLPIIPFNGALMEESVKQFRDWPWAAAVLIIGLGPGIGEELWCRAFLGRGLVGQYGVVLGVLLTSCWFGAIHLDPHQGTMAALMGLALHFSYLTTRSLLVPMLLHFLNNSLSVLGERLGETLAAIDVNADQVSKSLFIASGLLLLVVGWALYQTRARLAAADSNGPPPWQPAYPGVAHPPAGSGTIIERPALSVAAVVIVLAALAGWVAAFVDGNRLDQLLGIG